MSDHQDEKTNGQKKKALDSLLDGLDNWSFEEEESAELTHQEPEAEPASVSVSVPEVRVQPPDRSTPLVPVAALPLPVPPPCDSEEESTRLVNVRDDEGYHALIQSITEEHVLPGRALEAAVVSVEQALDAGATLVEAERAASAEPAAVGPSVVVTEEAPTLPWADSRPPEEARTANAGGEPSLEAGPPDPEAVNPVLLGALPHLGQIGPEERGLFSEELIQAWQAILPRQQPCCAPIEEVLEPTPSLLQSLTVDWVERGGVGEGLPAEEVISRCEHGADDADDRSRAADFLCEAARLAERGLGDDQRAYRLYSLAVDLEPRQATAVAGRRRLALRLQSWDLVDAAIDEELSLDLSRQERTELLLLKAELAFSRRGSPGQALDLCQEVERLASADPRPMLLRTEIANCEWDEGELAAQLTRLAPVMADPALQATLRVMVGRAHEALGDRTAAAQNFAAAAKSETSNPSALAGLARLRYGLGDFRGAARACADLARTFGPTEAARAYDWRAATLLMRNGDAHEAAQLLNDPAQGHEWLLRHRAAAARDDAAGAGRALLALARGTEDDSRRAAFLAEHVLLEDDQDWDEAQALLDGCLLGRTTALAVVARTELARRLGDLQALAAMAGEGEDPAVGVFRSAIILDHEGQDEEARLLFEGGMALPDSRVESEIVLATLAIRAQDWLGYVDFLHRAADRALSAEWRASVLQQIGRVNELWLGDRVAARAGYARALEAQAGFVPALQGLRRTAPEGISRVESARRLAEEIEPSSYALAMTIDAARVAEQAGDVAAALDVYYGAVSSQPHCLPALLGAERLLRKTGRVDELLDLWRLASRGESGSLAAYCQASVATHLAARRNDQGACEALTLATEALPGDVTMAYALARMALASGQAERLEETADRLPAQERLVALLGAASLWEREAPERALRCVLKVLDRHPQHPHATLALERLLRGLGREKEREEKLAEELRGTQDVVAQAALLQRLTAIAVEAKDLESELVWREASAEVEPDNLPNLHALAGRYLDQERWGDLARTYEKLSHIVRDEQDAAAYASLAFRWHGVASGEAFAALAPAEFSADRSPESVKAQLQLYWAAQHAGRQDLVGRAAARLVSLLGTPRGRAVFELRAADAWERLERHDEALGALQRAAGAYGKAHPVAHWRISRLAEMSGRWHEAAEAAVQAAIRARLPEHKTSEYLRAARLWLEKTDDQRSALKALRGALEADPSNDEAFHLAHQALQDESDPRLALEVITLRLQGEPHQEDVARLGLQGAKLAVELGDHTRARENLRAVVSADPTNLEALRRLGQVCADAQEWSEAAQCYLQLAVSSTTPEEVKAAYFQLGIIYHEHLPDMRRAIQSYQKVLSIDSGHLETLRRLSDLLAEAREWKLAAEVTARLGQVEPDFDRRREALLRLAHICETGLGDTWRAEQALDEARRLDPTNLTVISAMAYYYRRQKAVQALHVHLDRSAGDFRRLLETTPCDMEAYRSLFRVFQLREQGDGARLAAAVLECFGEAGPEESSALSATGGECWEVGPALASPELEDDLCPPAFSPSLRSLFSLAGEALTKLAPQDVKSLGLTRNERLGRDHPVLEQARSLGAWFGLRDVEVFVHPREAGAWHAFWGSPPVVVLGHGLLQGTTAAEWRFFLGGALALLQKKLMVLQQLETSKLALLIPALAKLAFPHVEPEGVDEAALASLVKDVARVLPRKLKPEIGPFAMECLGTLTVGAGELQEQTGVLADRYGCLAAGGLAPALRALEVRAGRPEPTEGPWACRGADPRVGALLRFFVSDGHLAARQALGIAGPSDSLRGSRDLPPSGKKS